jgi:hypothetical protein
MDAGSIEVSFHTVKEDRWLLLPRLSSEGWKYIENETADFGDLAVEGKIILKVNEDATGLVGLNAKLV